MEPQAKGKLELGAGLLDPDAAWLAPKTKLLELEAGWLEPKENRDPGPGAVDAASALAGEDGASGIPVPEAAAPLAGFAAGCVSGAFRELPRRGVLPAGFAADCVSDVCKGLPNTDAGSAPLKEACDWPEAGLNRLVLLAGAEAG